MNIRKFTYLLVILPSFFIGCHNKTGEDILSRISVGVELNPGTTLNLLDSIKKTTKLDKLDQARWNLLYIRAFDEKTFEIPNDSIVLAATEILCDKGTNAEKAYSNFYLGRMHANMEKNKEAMSDYIKALDLAKSVSKYDLAGLICNYMGDIYSKDKRYDKRIEKLKESFLYFSKARNMRGQIFALRDVAHSFLFKESTDSALVYCAQAEVLARKINDWYAIGDIMYEFGNTYWIKKDIESAEFYMKKALEFAVDSDQKKKFNVALIDIYYKQNRWNEAKEMTMNLILEPETSLTMRAANDIRMSNIEEKLGNYKEALKWYREYIVLYDSLNLSRRNIDTRDIEKEHQEMSLLNKVSFWESISIGALILFLLLMALLSVFIVRYLKTLKIKAIQLSEIDSLENKVKSLNKELQTYKEKLIYRSDIAQKAAILHSTPTHKRKELDEKIRGIFSTSKITKDDWINLDQLIEVAYPGLLKRIRESFPALTQEEIRVAMLKYLGVDNSMLSTIFEIQQQSVLTKNYRIRKKMQLNHEETVEDIINKMIGN